MNQYIITKKQIKNLKITIKSDGIVYVSAPVWYSDAKIHQRLMSKQERIQKAQQRLARKQPPPLDTKQCLLFGEIYTLISLTDQTNNNFLDEDAKTLVLPSGKTKEERLRLLAKEYLHKRMNYRSTKHNCTYNKLFIRSQTTKRGTCSSSRHISLNRKLITLPAWIIDYVICHELAHLTQMNHSKQFRAHCTSLYPQTPEAKRRMKTQGYMVG